MVLTIYYQSKNKTNHTYFKKVRSYKQMDEEEKKLIKRGYTIIGANYYK